jgi:hypothetical protein
VAVELEALLRRREVESFIQFLPLAFLLPRAASAT